MEEKNKKSCFVITPIGDINSSVRRKIDGLIDEVIYPVMKEAGYKVEVSHRITVSGTMTATIIRKVYECDLAIANLTGNNPNVMYEIGLRHAAAKPIIHITEDVKDLAFDVNDQRTIQYTDDITGAYELKERLKSMVSNIDLEAKVSNPITEALGHYNVVNISGQENVDFSDILLDIQSELEGIKNYNRINLFESYGLERRMEKSSGGCAYSNPVMSSYGGIGGVTSLCSGTSGGGDSCSSGTSGGAFCSGTSSSRGISGKCHS